MAEEAGAGGLWAALVDFTALAAVEGLDALNDVRGRGARGIVARRRVAWACRRPMCKH